jgi:hypothetical protein
VRDAVELQETHGRADDRAAGVLDRSRHGLRGRGGKRAEQQGEGKGGRSRDAPDPGHFNGSRVVTSALRQQYAMDVRNVAHTRREPY